MEAIRTHYLAFDWSKISLATSEGRKVWVAAYGQIFFTLSLGFGIMITYSSYLPEKTDIISNAVLTCVINCAYSLIAGLAVFGTIGYMAQAKGVPFSEAITGGPGLAFVVYPEAINQLPWGNRIFGAMFFLMLIVAGISSAISLTEAFTCSLCDKFRISRHKTVTALCLIGLAGSVIFTTRAGLFVLDIIDHFISGYALILGGILECVLVGWLLKASIMRKHIDAVSQRRTWAVWDFTIKYLTPVMLMLILFGALDQDFRAAYEGYPVRALLFFGGGVLLLSRLGAFVLSHFRWSLDKRRHIHSPDEEHLLT
jgi:NSS family neurotransmitter:Na+ symporter